MATGKTHHHPELVIDLCKKIASLDYISRTAKWIKEEFPGSASTMIPQLRAMHAEIKESEKKKRAAFLKSF